VGAQQRLGLVAGVVGDDDLEGVVVLVLECVEQPAQAQRAVV